MSDNYKKLGLFPLIGIIVGSMIGGGAFSLPTDMMRGAGIGSIIIAWIIAGVGMICLALVFQNLANRKPELKGGVYAYANAGFGKYIGFISALGYWISSFIGNVAYALILMNAMSYFFPNLLRDGTNIFSIVFASIFVWFVHFITLHGAKGATLLNLVITIAKLIPLFLFIIVMFFAWNWHNISFNFWNDNTIGTLSLGSVGEQVKSTMMVTVWIFIGIEGAVVLSGRAKSQQDVGKATVFGLLATIGIYLLLSFVTYAAVPREVLLTYHNPTLAYSLEYVVGYWGAIIINIGLCISLFGALLGWTLLAAEIPYIAAKDRVMPKFYAKENKYGCPSVSLWITNTSVQVFLIIAYFADSTYQLFYTFAAVLILLPYLLSALYGFIVSSGKVGGYEQTEKRIKDIILASVASIYGIWLVYAAGIDEWCKCAVLLVVGTTLFIISRKQYGKKIFNSKEQIIALILVVMAIWGIYSTVKMMTTDNNPQDQIVQVDIDNK